MRGPSVVYVGNLPEGVKDAEIQDLFERVSTCGGVCVRAPRNAVWRGDPFRARCSIPPTLLSRRALPP